MQDPSYQYLCVFVNDVNDVAERALKDVAEYAEMTRDPAYQDDSVHRGQPQQCLMNNVYCSQDWTNSLIVWSMFILGTFRVF